jgi:hypothetical protein
MLRSDGSWQSQIYQTLGPTDTPAVDPSKGPLRVLSRSPGIARRFRLAVALCPYLGSQAQGIVSVEEQGVWNTKLPATPCLSTSLPTDS